MGCGAPQHCLANGPRAKAASDQQQTGLNRYKGLSRRKGRDRHKGLNRHKGLEAARQAHRGDTSPCAFSTVTANVAGGDQ